MKHVTLSLTLCLVTLCLSASPVFAQHGGGHGAGPAMGPGMNPGRGHGPGSSSMGDEMSARMGKTPEQVLAKNTKLSDSLAKLLPPGTNLEDAARGFKNLGQFVAAAHVSHNLDLSFANLKAKMTSGESLGQAIHDLKPEVNGKDEAKKAHRQAKETIREAGS